MQPEPISFFVAGEPKAQPRVKAARIGGFVRMYTPPTAEPWKKLVREAARAAIPGQLCGPLNLGLRFYFERPKSHLKKDGSLTTEGAKFIQHTKKPDADNLAKAVMDAMTDASVWVDDDLIISLYISKSWTTPGNPTEGCSVLVSQYVE